MIFFKKVFDMEGRCIRKMKRGFMRRFLCALLCVVLVLTSLAFAYGDQDTGYRTLRYKTASDSPDGPAVKAMQQRLKDLGYKTSATGGYWEKTVAAVEAFQKAAGLPVNGEIATPEMQEALFASNAPKADGTTADYVAPTPEPTKVPEKLTNRVLSYRMENNDAVRAMQNRLNELGFMTGGSSGSYWGETQKAVKAFLDAVGLPGDGLTASPTMLEMLYASDAPHASSAPAVIETATPDPSATAAPTDTTAPGNAGSATATPAPTETPVNTALIYGMENNAAVKTMQTRLRELGFFNSSPTGNYYSVTASAVEAFQKAAGLTVNGKTASIEMQKLLYSASAPSAYSQVATYTELRLKMENNDQVRLMQRRLAALGYFNAQYVTGNYLILTARAVAEFQKAAGLPVNGNVATVETLKALYANTAPTYGTTTPPTTTPTSTVNPYSDLVFGSKGSGVRAMQTRLIELGYLNDVADGVYGRNTGNAVSAFQAAVHLAQNGNVASAEMQAILFSAAAPRMGSTIAPTGTATPTPTPTATISPYSNISFGDKGSAVRAMQSRLIELGYLNDVADGVYGKNTGAAVVLFQAAAHLAQNANLATAEMQAILFSAAAPRMGSTIAPTATGTTTPTPTPTATINPYTDIKFGDKGSAVKNMQARLKELGYLKDSADGVYGKNTGTAVAAFQAMVGLAQNANLASAEMQALLFASTAPSAGATTPSPSSRPSDKYSDLTYGMTMYQSVLNAQTRLIELGFLTNGGSTANYDDRTAAAVEAFQRYYGYYVNGKTLTGEQQELLFTSGTKEQLLVIRQGGTITPTTAPDYSKADLSKLLKKGSSGEQVTLLTTRLIELGYMTGAPTSYYSDAVVSAVMWFQNSNSLTPDGIAGSSTLTKIYTQTVLDAAGSSQAKPDITPTETEGTASKPSISSIQTIAWDNDTYFNRKTGIFKDGATATVTDVATGISYKVRRKGGYNHADVEPLTAYDTWQMFRIYNEKWSWDRHAVVVTFSNGVSSAASINGMPHGESAISDNNMDGHTCIHFSGSHTHGTDSLDPAHQAAVADAAKTSVADLQKKISEQQ